MKSVNVEVVKNAQESPTNLIRRFTKRVQGAGVLMRVRSLRYSQRPVSKFKRKKKALAIITKKALIEQMDKIGKPMIFKKKGRR